ncbi:MAG TPA: hypothetical protein VF331_25180 [Polyangiales bacterium]
MNTSLTRASSCDEALQLARGIDLAGLAKLAPPGAPRTAATAAGK